MARTANEAADTIQRRRVMEWAWGIVPLLLVLVISSY